MTVSEQIKEGLVTNNPVLVQMIGLCATLATSTSLSNGIGMGLSTTAVLICSNIVISLLRKIIPNKIRIAAYITVIAGFVTIVDLLIQAFLPALSASLGLFIPLIVVNCIILGRAEAFASKNSVVVSAIDGLFMGLGFTMTLVILSIIRELLGAGTLFSGAITVISSPATLMILPAGGFLTLGCVIAVMQKLTKKGE